MTPWYQSYPALATIAAAILAATVAIFLAVYGYRRSRAETTLDYEIVSEIKLLGSIRLTRAQYVIGGTALRDPTLALVRLQNTGRTPIATDDYDEDPQVSVSRGNIKAVIPSDASNNRLAGLQFDWTDDFATVPSPFMAASDWLELGIITDGDPGDIDFYVPVTTATRAPRDMSQVAQRPRKIRRVATSLGNFLVWLAAVILGSSGVVQILEWIFE